MKLLKLEKHDYSILYVNNNETYELYRRFNQDKWQILRNNEWQNIKSFDDLEKLYKENENSNSYLINRIISKIKKVRRNIRK